MKVYVYKQDRSECGMADPVIRRLKAWPSWWCADWRKADIVIIPGDRREAMRFALDVFEAGKKIWHLGACDSCLGDQYHWDGTYRRLISILSLASHGRLLSLGGPTATPCDIANDMKPSLIKVGPTMISDVPLRQPRPHKKPYVLLCYNPMVWMDGQQDFAQCPVGETGFAMYPGNDGERQEVKMLLTVAGWKVLPKMPREKFLPWVAHAKYVVGNSSLLTYEAPLWHDDDAIHFCGKRNAGRGTVKWNSKKNGDPADNVVKLLEKEKHGLQ